jgi:hypothetical protein
VNDSGAIVGGVTLTVIAVALAWLAVQTIATPPGPPASEPEPEPAAAEPVEPEPVPADVTPAEVKPDGVPARAGTERT